MGVRRPPVKAASAVVAAPTEPARHVPRSRTADLARQSARPSRSGRPRRPTPRRGPLLRRASAPDGAVRSSI